MEQVECGRQYVEGMACKKIALEADTCHRRRLEVVKRKAVWYIVD